MEYETEIKWLMRELGMTREEAQADIRKRQCIQGRIDAAVLAVCEQHGYGAVMQSASELWKEKEELAGRDGSANGAIVTGPCAGMIVPCGCKVPHKCDWCCGCSWLTEHVKRVKDELDGR